MELNKENPSLTTQKNKRERKDSIKDGTQHDEGNRNSIMRTITLSEAPAGFINHESRLSLQLHPTGCISPTDDVSLSHHLPFILPLHGVAVQRCITQGLAQLTGFTTPTWLFYITGKDKPCVTPCQTIFYFFVLLEPLKVVKKLVFV